MKYLIQNYENIKIAFEYTNFVNHVIYFKCIKNPTINQFYFQFSNHNGEEDFNENLKIYFKIPSVMSKLSYT